MRVLWVEVAGEKSIGGALGVECPAISGALAGQKCRVMDD